MAKGTRTKRMMPAVTEEDKWHQGRKSGSKIE